MSTITNEQPLRPYPELSDQDALVSRVCTMYALISKIINCVNVPFKKIYDLFFCSQKQKLVDKTISINPFFVKSKTETFDHKCNYIVRDAKVYFRPLAISNAAPWKEIPFDAIAKGISADGDNLIIIDEDNQIHYAKTDKIHFHMTANSWEITQFSLVWEKNWFNMDGISSVVNFFKPAALHVMENARSVAMSHKGLDALYYTDIAGKKHPDPIIGVTTLYMLNPTGTRIFFADPWLPNKFQNEITGPEEGQFIAESMDASASTLFLLQRAKNSQGKEINKLYTRYADFDSIGANPLLPATYDRTNTTPLVRILPGEDWLEQPSIPLEENARLTKRITLLQTGRGQAERQLRVEGTNRLGFSGYYFKKIYEDTWKFERTDHPIAEQDFLPKEERGEGLKKGPQITHDYQGWIQIGKETKRASLEKFSLKGWNERGLHTTLKIENIPYSLHARRGIKHLLSIKDKNPEYILMGSEKNPLNLKSQMVNVIKEPHQIFIKGADFTACFPRDQTLSVQSKLPSLPLQWLIHGMLAVLHPVKLLLKATRRIIERVTRNTKKLVAQEKILQSLILGDVQDTKQLMQRITSKDPSLTPKLLVNFLSQPQVLPHLNKLMKGANCLIEGNTDSLFQKLTQLKGAAQRSSSHSHQEGTSYGVETPLFGELLFWKDQEGCLRLQFEAHSLRNLFKAYYHLVDYLHYRLSGKQQGTYGSSKYTDDAPIIIKI